MKALQSIRYLLVIAVAMTAGIVIGDFWRPGGPKVRYALMERNGIIVNAVFGQGIRDAEKLKRTVLEPIQKVIDEYTAKGYVVIDVTSDNSCEKNITDEQSKPCAYTLLGLPKPIVEITEELNKAVDAAKKSEPTGSEK